MSSVVRELKLLAFEIKGHRLEPPILLNATGDFPRHSSDLCGKTLFQISRKMGRRNPANGPA